MTKNRYLITGEKYAEKLQYPIEKLGIIPVFVPNNPCLDPRLSGHADLSVWKEGEGRLLLAPALKETDFPEKLLRCGIHFRFAKIHQGPCYPQDVSLNACRIGKFGVCNPKVTANEIVRSFTNENLLISVMQGYAKCSICVIRDHAVITADRGIALALSGRGVEVLLINPGGIKLEGFPYGFIGGASILCNDGRVLFTGRISSHPDYERILVF